ncbi:DUF4397 domain-containing protein [Pedobacter sp. HMF7647]|uniref:DUF4397 domain-containing protein n=1 Tax=Hufsiella arboris TaxID=2695275 RepID=A0A7K1YG22_9SPHI|nr:DUF4397 domain-containing protein [Hufsiella arboris]MXV52939.1 DUF4397 domain-containing protein [Hufsiella arboris]
MRIARLVLISAFLYSLVLIVQSCKKDDSVKVFGYGNFGFINASPLDQSIDLYTKNVDDENAQSIKYNSDSTFSFVSPKFSYAQITQGNYLFDVKPAGKSNTLKIDTLGFNEGGYYSAFMLTKKDTANRDSNFIVSFKDDLISSTAPQRAKIRFLNFSPDAPALDLAIADTTLAPIASNRIFPSRDGGFIEIDASSSLILQIRQNGTSDVRYELPAFNARAGYLYTIYAKGYWNRDSTGTKAFSAVRIQNKDNQ